jgi:hypothetical protein
MVGPEMPPEPYTALTEALAAVGLTGQRIRPEQLVVSAQAGLVWPNRGNSFWLSYNQGLWYLSTWLPACYRIPANQNIVSLCLACMAIGTSVMHRVPPDLVARFQLQEIDERQYERLFPTEGDGD